MEKFEVLAGKFIKVSNSTFHHLICRTLSPIFTFKLSLSLGSMNLNFHPAYNKMGRIFESEIEKGRLWVMDFLNVGGSIKKLKYSRILMYAMLIINDF